VLDLQRSTMIQGEGVLSWFDNLAAHSPT
jgi:hypothetical protein